jgi:hypothetical protein
MIHTRVGHAGLCRLRATEAAPRGGGRAGRPIPPRKREKEEGKAHLSGHAGVRRGSRASDTWR